MTHSLRRSARASDLSTPRPSGKGIAAILALWPLTACALFPPSGNPSVPPPARAVDVQSYLGEWHEFARYDVFFERGCTNATATYTPRPDGKLGIVNACTRNGHVEYVEGKARIEPNSRNTRLRVSFFGPFYVGAYWVLDHAEDYSWTIIGEPTGAYLWILTRAPIPTTAQRQALIARTAALGYDTSRLVFTGPPAP